MAFPFQQPPPNFPGNQMSMFPGQFSRGMGGPGGPGNMMFPARGVPSAPKGNVIQNMLSRFLPSGGAQQAASLPAQAATGAQTAGGGLAGTLNNVQQVLNVVQQTAPVVKEYGPMVKNIPAMLRMMKAFNASDNEDSDSTGEETADQSTDQPDDQARKQYSDKSTATEKTVSSKRETKQQPPIQKEKRTSTKNGESRPMLFI